MTSSESAPRGDRRRLWPVVFVAALVLYAASACPVVFWGDSAELSRRALTLDLSPTARGYPLHRLVSFLAGRVAGDAALGANLVSALFGAATVALVFEIGRRLGRSVASGAAAAAITGLAHTFWSYSAVAEVYTLHTALMLCAILLAIASDTGSVRTRVALGAVLGLSLLHHRMIVFAVPGLVLWTWTGTPARERLRAFLQVAAGAALGAVPFVVLCAVASRTPPEGEASPFWWWFRDVFMGGDRNADFLLGAGRKGAAASALYLGRWLVFNLPGPALLLAVFGFASAGRRIALLLGAEAVAHVWFPMQYDWTGDQYTFLIPLYPILALAAAVGVGRLVERGSRRLAAAATIASALAPVALYGILGFTPLGPRALPGLTEEAARSTIVPVRTGDRTSRDWCAARLAALPPGARLHADWGDGQVYLYVQEAQRLRRDVTVNVWNTTIRLGDGAGEEWVSVLPFTREPPKAVAAVMDRLDSRGDGLFRVRPR